MTGVKVSKVGRNEPCPCNSGLKFKKCCGRFHEGPYVGSVSLRESDEPSVGEIPGKMIVKVQLPIGGNMEVNPALVYDRDRSFQRYVPVGDVAERMQDRPKAYFYATLKFGQLALGDEAPWQPW